MSGPGQARDHSIKLVSLVNFTRVFYDTEIFTDIGRCQDFITGFIECDFLCDPANDFGNALV